MVEKKWSLQQQKWVPMLAHGSVIVGYNAFHKGACSRGSRTDLLPEGDGSQVMRMHGMIRLLVLAQGRLFLLRSRWRFMQKARPGPIKVVQINGDSPRPARPSYVPGLKNPHPGPLTGLRAWVAPNQPALTTQWAWTTPDSAH